MWRIYTKNPPPPSRPSHSKKLILKRVFDYRAFMPHTPKTTRASFCGCEAKRLRMRKHLGTHSSRGRRRKLPSNVRGTASAAPRSQKVDERFGFGHAGGEGRDNAKQNAKVEQRLNSTKSGKMQRHSDQQILICWKPADVCFFSPPRQ